MMSRQLSVILVLIFTVLLPGLNSCVDISCTDETTAFVKLGFYSDSSRNLAVPDSLTLYGEGMALKIYDKATITQPALIPLNDSADYAKFIIEINGVTDTIEFVYWSYPHLISKECGYSMFHTLDTVIFTKNKIVSLDRVNPDVTTQNVENLQIYY